MSIRSLVPAAAALAFAALPAAALAQLQVNVHGFDRVVATASSGSCEVLQGMNETAVQCADGSRGTMIFYRTFDEGPACELDFWFRTGAAPAQQWGADISRRSASNGNCALQRISDDTLQVSIH